MTYPEWVPLVMALFGLVTTIINALIAFNVKTWTDRISRLEADKDNVWRQISNMRVDSARDGATRSDLEKIQQHLQNQDKQLVAINTLVARLVPQAQHPFTTG